MHDLIIRNGRIVDGTGAETFIADVAIDGDKISEVGNVAGSAKREIDAAGKLVTPGFVDAHTHYDGQVTWDSELAPSSWHGVTTVVMGNCGVGFAPARPAERDFMIQVMEGVEEIPGAALREGIPWAWESFPEYLDFLDGMERTIDVAAQVPHCALRCYVMGEERAMEDLATADDIKAMAAITREAVSAGAVGFSTSRTMIHRVAAPGRPVVPGTHCSPEELIGIATAMGEAGNGVFQMLSDGMADEADFPWMERIVGTTGHPLIFTLTQRNDNPEQFREALKRLEDTVDRTGGKIRAGVGWRPPGVLMGLQATLNPFTKHPTFRQMRKLPQKEQLAELRDPETREQLLSETCQERNGFLRMIYTDFENMFFLGEEPDYEPAPETSIAAQARLKGISPEELALDYMCEGDGLNFIFFPLSTYVSGDLSAAREMMVHPLTTASLSDAGAHVGTVCDASVTTFMLTHWTRDRARGPKLALEEVIRKQTSEPATLYGFHDRGILKPGMKADVNVIDFDNLTLHAPYMAYDLPQSGKRLLQQATGYDYTICSGQVIAEGGNMTGARPGKLVRGKQYPAT